MSSLTRQKKEISMTSDTTLVNFHIPRHLKGNVDDLCKYKGVSRTAVLNSLCEWWIRNEYKMLEQDGRMREFILKTQHKMLEGRRKPNPFKRLEQVQEQDMGLPLPILSNHYDDYDPFSEKSGGMW